MHCTLPRIQFCFGGSLANIPQSCRLIRIKFYGNVHEYAHARKLHLIIPNATEPRHVFTARTMYMTVHMCIHVCR